MAAAAAAAPRFKGILRIVAHQAVGLRDVQLIGKQDPYVKFTIGKQHFRTKTHDDGGRNPNWKDEAIDFNVDESNKEMMIEVFDTELTVDRDIAQVVVQVADVVAQPGKRKLALRSKAGEASGEIELTFEYFPALALTLAAGENLHDEACCGSMSSYVKLDLQARAYGTTRVRSRTAPGGRNPRYDQTFYFNVLPDNRNYPSNVPEQKVADPKLRFEVFAEKTFCDDVVGYGSVALKDLMQSAAANKPLNVELQRSDKRQGGVVKVNLALLWAQPPNRA